ncbi:MAG: ChpI protein [Okeania sp. SIO3B3]|nr:ChpI protein [Okeania sp. SIO3B3]
MKTAISIPDALFLRADKYAQEHSLSRSAMISEALDEFLKERQKDDLIERINQAVDLIGNDTDDAVIRKSKAMLRRLEW